MIPDGITETVKKNFTKRITVDILKLNLGRFNEEIMREICDGIPKKSNRNPRRNP